MEIVDIPVAQLLPHTTKFHEHVFTFFGGMRRESEWNGENGKICTHFCLQIFAFTRRIQQMVFRVSAQYFSIFIVIFFHTVLTVPTATEDPDDDFDEDDDSTEADDVRILLNLKFLKSHRKPFTGGKSV